MSTKTTFKRIALVTVAAMGFGLMTAIPSNAAVAQADSLTGAAASSATTATAATTNLVFSFIADHAGDDMSITTQVLSSPLTSSVVAVTFAKTALSTSASTAYTTGNIVTPSAIDTRTTAYITASFTPDAAGTYVIRFTPVGGTNNTPLTWTVTAASPVYNHSIVALAATGVNSSSVDGVTGVLGSAAVPNTSAIGTVSVAQYSSSDETIASVTSILQPVTVSISKGMLSQSTGTYFSATSSVTTVAATAGLGSFNIYANGSVGSATLTISVGSTVVATKTITFKGTAVALAVSADKVTIGPSASGRKTAALTVTATDSAGNAATSVPAYTCTSGTTATATVSVSTVTGVAAGSTVITCASNDSSATSASVTINVAPDASATATTLTFDKDSYSPGELMTITIGAAANDYASYVAFTGTPQASENLVTVSGLPSGGTVALVNGTATWKAYAPLATGPLTITATSGSTAVVATTTVAADTSAADAAAEATDAANAATDAANAAAEAADAATAAAQDAADAVATLSTQVATLIAGLKAQLTALTNLVIKIQKKVKA